MDKHEDPNTLCGSRKNMKIQILSATEGRT